MLLTLLALFCMHLISLTQLYILSLDIVTVYIVPWA